MQFSSLVNMNSNQNQKNQKILDDNLVLDSVRVSEYAALAAHKWVGLGNEKEADQAAVDAMRKQLNGLTIDGTIVIGEGERDKAPMLYIGEKVGTGTGTKVDIALDPLEGTTICATGNQNSLAVIAITETNGFLHAPDVYMDKIAVGNNLPEGVVNIDDTPEQNLKNLAKAKNKDISELVVIVLKRTRHEELIAKIREAGARINLIGDGDVAGVLATTNLDSNIDMYIGIGGAPEGVLAAAALRTTGGQMYGRLIFSSNEERERAKKMGINEFSKIYNLNELVSGKDVIFSATGVTDGQLLNGVRASHNSATTESLVMRAQTGTIRTIKTQHNFTIKG